MTSKQKENKSLKILQTKAVLMKRLIKKVYKKIEIYFFEQIYKLKIKKVLPAFFYTGVYWRNQNTQSLFFPFYTIYLTFFDKQIIEIGQFCIPNFSTFNQDGMQFFIILFNKLKQKLNFSEMPKKINKQPKPKKQTNKAVKQAVTKSKKVIKQDNDASRNIFTLTKRINNKTVSADMCYVQDKNKVKRPGFSVVNRDGLYFTPLFFLPDEQNLNYRRQHKKMHEDRQNIQVSQIDVKDILIPRPSARNSYCTLCKTRFDDYLEHIERWEHKQKMFSSPFNADITELCLKYRPQPKSIASQSNITKSYDQTSTGAKMIAPFEESVHGNEQCDEVIYQGIGDMKQLMYYKLKKISKMSIQNDAQNVFDVINQF